MDECGEHNIELLEAREDSPEGFEPTEEPFNLVAFFVDFAIIFPLVEAINLWRDDRFEIQCHDQLSGFVAFVCAVHNHGLDAFRTLGSPFTQEFPAFGAVAAVSC